MATGRVCGKCSAPLTGVGHAQLCPGCLLEGGLASAAETQVVLDPSPIAGPESQIENIFPRPFGDYELLEEIARGGMGIVYKARQASLDRTVAVKMLLFGPLAKPEFVQRFRAEAAAAASLRHPNIVAIHEVGYRDGQHFFAMDYVEGQNLAMLVADQPLPARRAAAYVKTIAEAIHFAHERNVLHRDLKPSNVLIDAATDQPRVTDFGLAKRLDKNTELTLSGQVLGSPNYMPPEQAAADRGLVGKRSDVYSVGAILYHLLTGRAPFVAETVTDILQLVQSSDPVSPRALTPSVPRDLETICLKCLEKEPGQRYQTAQALADDLGRLLNDEPIQARPVGTPEKFWRWCRRNPKIAGLATLAWLIFLVGFAGVTWQGRRAAKAAAETKAQRNVAQGRLYAAQMKLAHVAYKAGKVGGALELLRAQKPLVGQPDFRGFEWRFLYRLCQSSQSEVLSTNASGFSAVSWSSDNRTVAFGSSDGRVELFDLRTRQLSKRWQAHEGSIGSLRFSPHETSWLATVGADDGRLKLWDVAHARAILSTNSGRGMWVHLAFSPNRRLLTASGPDGRSLNLWEIESIGTEPTPRVTLRTNFPFLGPVEFSRDGRTLVLCNGAEGSPTIAFHDLATQATTLPRYPHGDYVRAIAFSPDGNIMASGGMDERIFLWDVKERRTIRSLEDGQVINFSSLAFGPDGQTLFAATWDQNIRRWNLKAPDKPAALRGHSAGVDALALSPDGATLASAGRDGTARLWVVRPENLSAAGDPLTEFTALFDNTTQPKIDLINMLVAASPDQRTVVAARTRALIVCELARGGVLATAPVTNVFEAGAVLFRSVACSPDGRTIAAGGGNGFVALLDAVTLQRMRDPMRLHETGVTDIVFGLNGRVLVTGGGWGGNIKLTDVATGRLMQEIPGIEGHPAQPLAVSADGKLLATGSPDRSICLWDIESGRRLARSPQKVRFLDAVAFSPVGNLIAFNDGSGVIHLWDRTGRRPIRKWVGHPGPVLALAFSPNGRTLASASMDHTIKLWHPDIDQEVATLTGHTDWIWKIAFTENGNALVSGSRDGTLKLWRALSFDEIEAQEKGGRIAP